MTKTCRKCNVEKDTALFSKYKRNKDGLHSWCKPCFAKNAKEKQYAKKWQMENKDKWNAYMKDYQKGKSGVYGIFENGVCLYVGESTMTKSRLRQHRHWEGNIISEKKWNKGQPHLYDNLRKHNHLIYGVLEYTDNHKEREKYYINKLKPLYNGRM